MESEITKLIALLGGSSVIIIGVSTWISKLISNGVLESYKTSNQKDIEGLKFELATTREIALRNSNAQYDLYMNLWNTLQDLKSISDRLWEKVTYGDVEFLSKQLVRRKL